MGMTRYNDKQKVRDFYDRLSPYSEDLWGKHLHHGYWIDGKETKDRAQIQLIEHLAHLACIGAGSKVLDVGCGFGGSTIHLARHYGAETTGITISPIQVEMAEKTAAREGVNPKFLLMDAEEMKFDKTFDVIWSVESISHYPNKDRFFCGAAKCMESGGTLAIIDWFKKERLTEREYSKFIQPIEKGMLVEMDTMEDYVALLRANGFQLVYSEVLNKNCSKTWDFCMDMLKSKALWRVAAENGPEFLDFLRAFRRARSGFASGNFVYGLMIAKRI